MVKEVSAETLQLVLDTWEVRSCMRSWCVPKNWSLFLPQSTFDAGFEKVGRLRKSLGFDGDEIVRCWRWIASQLAADEKCHSHLHCFPLFGMVQFVRKVSQSQAHVRL